MIKSTMSTDLSPKQSSPNTKISPKLSKNSIVKGVQIGKKVDVVKFKDLFKHQKTQSMKCLPLLELKKCEVDFDNNYDTDKVNYQIK